MTLGFGDACDERSDGADVSADDSLRASFVRDTATEPVPPGVSHPIISAFPVCHSARGARTGVLLV